MNDLPITAHLGNIVNALLESPSQILILTAETGAGKSTAVPQAFLSVCSGKIIMLEPRRIATLAIAERIAESLGENCGQSVGYRMRLETCVSNKTRIEIMTEAILVRMIQTDPSLAGVSVVILDEFHERSINCDLALVLLREVLQLRSDLRVLIMSATIDTERIKNALDAPVYLVPGRCWPVEILYRPVESSVRIGAAVAKAIKQDLLEENTGDILAFLPGIADIRQAAEHLNNCGAEVLLLHGSLSFDEQKNVFYSRSTGRRVILSSAIAETSITVPGVKTIIDCGLARISRLDSKTGMARLGTEPESEFSAAQRAGRAGRLGPGRCIRLWSPTNPRVTETPPEIVRSDLIPLVLECAVWGARKMEDLDWLDQPNPGAWATAREILIQMGVIESSGAVTEKGKIIAHTGLHPRHAAILLHGDIDLVLDLVDRQSGKQGSMRERDKLRKDLERRLSQIPTRFKAPSVEPFRALLEGFPDRIALHKEGGTYQFPSGRIASLPYLHKTSLSMYPEWIVAPEVDSGEREGKIYVYEPIPTDDALSWLNSRAERLSVLDVSGLGTLSKRKIMRVERTLYGKIVLLETRTPASTNDIPAAFCQMLKTEGFSSLPWTPQSRSFFLRIRFYNSHVSQQIPNESSLLEDPETWLVPFLTKNGILDEQGFLESLRWRFNGFEIDRCVPSKITLANGITRSLSWEELVPGEPPVPVLETRVQDFYGCSTTPSILGEPVLLRLLSPARRPVQTTRDLSGFWSGSWKDVRKEMKGRYPRHHWPENPLEL